MADNTWDKIGTRHNSNTALNDRMDETAKLLHWDDDPYQLVKPDGKTQLRDAISVTPNLPKVFAHNIISDLMSGKWQVRVEGNVSKSLAHEIELFCEDSFEQADETLLENHDIPSLNDWLCNHVCVRYAIGVRWISQFVDGKWEIDLLPTDMRWTPYVQGKWAAHITFRTRYDLEEDIENLKKMAEKGIGEWLGDEYGFTLNKGKVSNVTNYNAQALYEKRDYWDGEFNELWVDKKLIYKQRNPWGYYPFVFVIPATGFMLRDKTNDSQKHLGEDILYLNKGLYTELARSLSLEQTSGYAGLYPGYEYETDSMDDAPADLPPGIDETKKRIRGERHEPVPRGDLNRAGQTARVDIQNQIQSGGPMSPKDYPTPPSAVLLAGETELIDRLQNARKSALGIFRSRLAKLAIDQFIQAKGEARVGRTGMRKQFAAKSLGNPDDYSVSYQLLVKNKRQELANLAEFSAVYDKLPLEWNLSNILMVDDPDGVIEALELQKAKENNPAIGFLELAVKYARAAEHTDDEDEKELKKVQSRILTHEYVMTMRQRMGTAPGQIAQPQQPRGNTQLLTSLAGQAMRGEAVGQRQEEVVQ